MSTNVSIRGINMMDLSDEQKQELASILGISIEDIKVSGKKAKEVNNLQMKEGSETIAIDLYDGHEFDITLLSEDELAQAKKTGLSPDNYHRYEEGLKIKELIKGKAINRGSRNAVSAGEQIRNIIAQNQSNVNEAMMNILLDKEKSRKLFRLAYPLFIEIPSNASEEDKKEMRKVRGTNRFSRKEYTFDQLPGRAFFMTNDLYAKNIELIQKYFNASENE